MNYYIDFDNTLYNTSLLTEKMLSSIVESIKKEKTDINSDKLYAECKSMFNRTNIYNIYELATFFANKYDVDTSEIINNLNSIILNGDKLVFKDSIPFLNKLKSNGHKLYLLSHSKDNLEYQSIKIAGSKLTHFFDALYITSVPKYTLDIDYKNSIFIDDNPDYLLGLYSRQPKQVIRLRRKESKYSINDIENKDIKEYLNFDEINIM